MVDVNRPFDFYQIFVNEIIGDLNLAVFVALIILIIAIVKFKIPYEAGLLLILDLLCIIFAFNQGLLIIWILVIIFVGINLGYMVNRIYRR